MDVNDEYLPTFITDGVTDSRLDVRIGLIEADFGSGCKMDIKGVNITGQNSQKRSEGFCVGLEDHFAASALSIVGCVGSEHFLNIQGLEASFKKSLVKR